MNSKHNVQTSAFKWPWPGKISPIHAWYQAIHACNQAIHAWNQAIKGKFSRTLEPNVHNWKASLKELAAFRPFGPQVLDSNKWSPWREWDFHKKGKNLYIQRDIYCKKQNCPSSPISLGRDPKTFSNLKTNKASLGKIGQGVSEKNGYKELPDLRIYN